MSFFFALFKGILMAIQIANTQFVTTQKSNLATPDVYQGKSVDKVPTNAGAPQKAGALDEKLAEAAKLQPRSFAKRYGEFLDRVKKIDNKILKGEAYMEDAKALWKDREKILKDLRGGVLTDVLVAYGYGDKAAEIEKKLFKEKNIWKMVGVLSEVDPAYQDAYKTMEKAFKAKDTDTAAGIFKMLEGMADSKGLMKIFGMTEADQQFVKGMLAIAGAMKVPELVDKIWSKVKNRRARKKIAAEMLPILADIGDVYGVAYITEELNVWAVTWLDPEIIEKLLSSYRTSHGGPPTEDDAQEFLAYLASINPDWAYTYRNGEKVWNLSMFAYLSEHARIILLRSDEFKYPTSIGYLGKVASFQDLMLEHRPWIKLPEDIMNPKAKAPYRYSGGH